MEEIQNFLSVLCGCLAIFLIRIYFGAGHIPDRSPKPAKPLKFFETHNEESEVGQSTKITQKWLFLGFFTLFYPFLALKLDLNEQFYYILSSFIDYQPHAPIFMPEQM